MAATAAPAKVNLGLRITGKRADGYHELWTVFQALDWGDTVHARTRPEPGISLTAEATAPRTDVPLDERNLAHRAAAAWMAEAGVELGLDLHLTKRVPAGAGLGGGSSDAAAVLRLLEHLGREQGVGLAAERLRRIAAGLGSDVPFFLDGGTQLGVGTGTDLRPVVGMPAQQVLLMLPAIGCETRRVYENFRPQWIEPLGPDSVGVVSPVPFHRFAVPDLARNDLRDAAFAAYPELGRLFAALVHATGRADLRMSGSGSTLFLVDEDPAVLEAVAVVVGRDFADSVPRLVRTSWGRDLAACAVRAASWPVARGGCVERDGDVELDRDVGFDLDRGTR